MFKGFSRQSASALAGLSAAICCTTIWLGVGFALFAVEGALA